MSWACAVDCDPNDVYFKTSIKKARKDHRCSHCRLPIKKGTPYEKMFAVYDGDPWTEKWHAECEALMREAAEIMCGETTIAFGSTLDGAAGELLACELGKYIQTDPEVVKEWMLAYGEILEKYDG